MTDEEIMRLVATGKALPDSVRDQLTDDQIELAINAYRQKAARDFAHADQLKKVGAMNPAERRALRQSLEGRGAQRSPANDK